MRTGFENSDLILEVIQELRSKYKLRNNTRVMKKLVNAYSLVHKTESEAYYDAIESKRGVPLGVYNG